MRITNTRHMKHKKWWRIRAHIRISDLEKPVYWKFGGSNKHTLSESVMLETGEPSLNMFI